MSEIATVLKNLSKQKTLPIVVCSVDSVDKNKCVCDLKPINGGADLKAVRLRSIANDKDDGAVKFPKKDSIVIVAMLENSKTAAYVIAMEEVESIQIKMQDVEGTIKNGTAKLKAKKIELEADETKFNGGSNKGLVLLDKIVQQLNKLEQDNNTLKLVFSGWTPVFNDGGTALKIAAGTWYGQQLVKTVGSDLENTKVKQ